MIKSKRAPIARGVRIVIISARFGFLNKKSASGMTAIKVIALAFDKMPKRKNIPEAARNVVFL